MSQDKSKAKDKVTHRRDEYVRQIHEYSADIVRLQKERILLEQDLKFLDSKIQKYREIVFDLRVMVEGYSQFMGVTDDVEEDNAINPLKVEFVKNIVPETVAPPTAKPSETDLCVNYSTSDNFNQESNIYDEPSAVTTQKKDSQSEVGNIATNESSSTGEDYPLLNLLSSSKESDTKILGRKSKYRLKEQFAGLGISEAAEIYMSQNPNQVYHVSDLVGALYDGVNDSNASSIYKTLSTQLLLVSKKKGRIKRQHKATYYYS
ncbi:hypothetical protein CAL7716_102440 (plasmid) [Calothrix sp. PCC 7716]|nr:hypothetical protein CAL7716_102440 [Calothrix sp. PCC 7716]